MHKRFLIAASALAVLAGCGGGGGSSISSGGGGPIPAPEAAPVGSAKFTVDARTGEVKVEPISASRAAFSGGALSFTSSVLLSEGSPERRILRVTAKNNTRETIGASGRFKVLFTNFQNANTPLTDLRSLVQTSTVWGTGTFSTTLGGQTTAAIAGPVAVDYEEAAGTLLSGDSFGWFLAAQGGTVKRLLGPSITVEGVFAGTGFRLLVGDSAIYLSNGEEFPVLLAGGTSGSVDGTFAAARFSNINDCFIYRSTGPNDFEAVVADGNLVRRVERNLANPNGLVTTILNAVTPVNGVTYKNGVTYAANGNAVTIFNSSTISTIGSIATSGYIDGLQANVRFSTPSALRWVGNSLFVADSGNHRIRQLNLRPGGSPFSANNWWASTVSGNGTASGVDGTGVVMTHNNPVGLAKGPGETLFVADQSGNRIRKITPTSNRFLDNFGDSTANPTDLPQLANPTDYVPSSSVRTPMIVEEKSISAGGSVTLGDWQFNLPEGLKSFSFVITVEAETTAPGVLPSVSNTGSGTKGSPLVSLRTLAGSAGTGYIDGSAVVSAFNNIGGVCASAAGDVFVADSINSAIRRISRNGQVTTILGPTIPASTTDGVWPNSSCQTPNAIACSEDGRVVYFAQGNYVVRRLALISGDPAAAQNWRVTTIAGSPGTFGAVYDTKGDLARIGLIYGITIVSENTIAFADVNNHVVGTIQRRGANYASSDHYVYRLAGGLGIPGFLDSSGSTARFNSPYGIAMSKSGYLYVTDRNNSRIRRVDLTGSTTTAAGSSLFGYIDSNIPSSAQFRSPFGIAVEPSGYIYVSDSDNKNIRRISPAGAVTTVAGTALVNGFFDGTGNSGTFSNPLGIGVGPGGDLFVADGNRIRILQRIITD